MKILNDFAIAVAHPGRYKELMNNKMLRVLIYAIIIIAVGSVSLVMSATQLKGILETFYENSVPEFVFENNVLETEEPFELNIGGILVKADSSEEFSQEDMGSAMYGFLFGKNTMVIRSSGRTLEAKYTDLELEKNFKLSKKILTSYSFVAEKLYNIFSVFVLVTAIIGFFIGALIVAMLALIPNRNVGLKFGNLYKMAIYSRGLPIMLSFILSRLIGGVPGIVSIIISFVIMNIALMNIAKDRFMKNHPDVPMTYEALQKMFEDTEKEENNNNMTEEDSQRTEENEK